MEPEELAKKLEWLDKEQRQSKLELADLKTRLANVAPNLETINTKLKAVSDRLEAMGVAAARLEQFDKMLAKHRADVTALIENSEKEAARRDRDAARLRITELEDIRKQLFEMKGAIGTETSARRAREDQIRNVALQDLKLAVDQAVQGNKQLTEAHAATEEARRTDFKRLADLQTEMAGLRRRTDDSREKTILLTDRIQNAENRLSEMVAAEEGRVKGYSDLLQQQSLAQIERDRIWKEWLAEFAGFRKQAVGLDQTIAAIQDTIHTAQKAQQDYESVNQRLERRVGEIGEIQRLGEDRLRNEWMAFRAEQQKTWSGFTVGQDEAARVFTRDLEKITKRLTELDDLAQTTNDQLQQSSQATEAQLLELSKALSAWYEASERIMGRTKAKPRKTTR